MKIFHGFRKENLTKKVKNKIIKEMIFFFIVAIILVPVTFLSYNNNLGEFMHSINKVLAVISIFVIGNLIYLGDAMWGGKTYTSYY